jgi:hypothetical protein
MLELPERIPAAPPGSVVRLMIAPSDPHFRLFRRLCNLTSTAPRGLFSR